MLQKNWMELIKPSKMDVNVEENDGSKGRLIAEPLERGFGLTLGNAIRRVLLSSCLLYTSPSPRDRTRSRMPSSA